MLDDVSSICLVRECKELEGYFGTHVTESILTRSGVCSMRAVKKQLKKVDKEITWNRCSEKTPLISDVEKCVGWTKLWDAALDLGANHTRGLQALSRLMSHHGRGSKPCPMCDESGPLTCLLDHNYFEEPSRSTEAERFT